VKEPVFEIVPKDRKKNKKDLTDTCDLLFDLGEKIMELDVNNENFMKELARAKVVAYIFEQQIKGVTMNVAMRKLNNSMLSEPKQLKLLEK
jgi:hypothetical protein